MSNPIDYTPLMNDETKSRFVPPKRALYQALGKFRDQQGAIAKASSSKRVFKSKYGGSSSKDIPYANYLQVREAIDNDLSALGLIITHQCELINDRMRVTTKVIHIDSGEYLETTIPLAIKNDEPQELGKAITYYCRYGLNCVLGLKFVEDNDGETKSRYAPPQKVSHTPPIAAPIPPVSDKRFAEIKMLIQNELRPHGGRATPALLTKINKLKEKELTPEQQNDIALIEESIAQAHFASQKVMETNKSVAIPTVSDKRFAEIKLLIEAKLGENHGRPNVELMEKINKLKERTLTQEQRRELTLIETSLAKLEMV